MAHVPVPGGKVGHIGCGLPIFAIGQFRHGVRIQLQAVQRLDPFLEFHQERVFRPWPNGCQRRLKRVERVSHLMLEFIVEKVNFAFNKLKHRSLVAEDDFTLYPSFFWLPPRVELQSEPVARFEVNLQFERLLEQGLPAGSAAIRKQEVRRCLASDKRLHSAKRIQ